MYDIFLSYHWQDHQTVESVASALRARKLRVFLDRWYLVPGRTWIDVLERTIAECRAVAIFLGPHGLGSWQQREKEMALDRQTREPDFPVIPVLLPGAAPALGFIKLHSWVDLRNGPTPEMVDMLARAARGQSPEDQSDDQAVAALSELCPYRGLQYFREEDEPLFCGRTGFTKKLVEAVLARNFIAVVGASGSGKSSVVRAGLIPALRRGDDQRQWEVLTTTPGDRPLHALAECFLPALEPDIGEVDLVTQIDVLAARLSSGEAQLRTTVDRVLKKLPYTDRLLLVVDQWEELYTLCPEEALRQRFVQQLLDASTSSRLTVVLTLRGDFYGHAISDRRLSDRLQGGIVNIAPMTREELQSAVVEPAQKVGLQFERGLVKRILKDVGEEPAQLPLLEFLLRELWEKRQAGLLLHEAYDAIGGVQRAIAERAEQAFKALADAEQEEAHWALIQLVAPGQGAEDTRRRAVLNDLGPLARSVVAKLATERLLVTTRDADGREWVEVGHEALIREWQRLRQWVNEDREFLAIFTRLAGEAKDWQEQGKRPDLLIPPGRRLAEAQELLGKRPGMVGPLVGDYIGASAAAERERQEENARRERELFEERARVERERLERQRLEAEHGQRQAQAAAELEREHRNRLEEAQLAAVQRANDAWRWSQVLAIILAIMIGCVYWVFLAKRNADHQANVAQHQEAMAQHHFGVALKSTTGLLYKIREMRSSGDMSPSAAKELLTEANATLESLDQANPTPEVRKNQLAMLLTVSDLYVDLGDNHQARKYAETARRLATDSADNDQANPEWQWALYQSVYRIADVMAKHRDINGAAAEYRAALKFAQQLAHTSHDNVGRQTAPAFIHNKIGDIYKMQGKLNSALDEYRTGQRVLEQLKITHGQHPHWTREMATVRTRAGETLIAGGEAEQALAEFRSALADRERLAQQQPDNDIAQSQLSTILARVGDLLIQRRQFNEGLEHYQRTLRIRRELAEKDPQNAPRQSQLAYAHQYIGDALRHKGELDAALGEHRTSFVIRKKIADKDPENGEWQNNVAISLMRIGDFLAEQEKFDQATDQYHAAVHTLKKLVARQPAISSHQRDLFNAYGKMAGTLQGKDDIDGAIQTYRVALEGAEPLLEKERGMVRWPFNPAHAYTRIGDLLKARGDLDGAFADYQVALKRARYFSDSEPRSEERRRDVAVILGKIADVLVERNGRGKSDQYRLADPLIEARREYRGAEEILEQLSGKNPQSEDLRRELEGVRQKLQGL